MQKLILSILILFVGFHYSNAQQTRGIFSGEVIYGSPMNVITFQYTVHKRPGTNKADTTLRDTVFYDQNGNTLESHTRTGYQQTFSIIKYSSRYNEQKVKMETTAPIKGGSLVLKYDDKGNVKELDNILRNGTLAYKALYKYDKKGNPIEYDQYDMDDSLRLRRTYQYNDKGFVTEQNDYSIHYNTSNPKDQTEGELFTKTKYTYDAFDDKGNWTKRTTYIGFTNIEPTKSAITERKIFYFRSGK